MPDECVHNVDFDVCEVIFVKRGQYKIRVGCKKCGTEVTLDHVLASLASKVYDLNQRLLELEKGDGDVESVARPGA